MRLEVNCMHAITRRFTGKRLKEGEKKVERGLYGYGLTDRRLIRLYKLADNRITVNLTFPYVKTNILKYTSYV